MREDQLYPRTILFDEKLLTQLNEYALRNGLILENWLPLAIKETLLPSLKQKEIVGLENLVPELDFEMPFTRTTFSIPDMQHPYQLGNPEFEAKSIQRTSKIDLRGNYNRLFPVILCVRVMAIYTQREPISINEYYSKLRKHAYQVRLSLLDKMKTVYRQRGPYDGLPGHRTEERIRTAAKEKSSWSRFLRFFAEVSDRPGSGGLAQRLGLVTINDDGKALLTPAGKELAMLQNPILDDWDFGYDERLMHSTLSVDEAGFFVHQIKCTHPNEAEKMGELFHLMANNHMNRSELLKSFYIFNGMSDAKKSTELNGLLGRAIDLHLVEKNASNNDGGDGRSHTAYGVNFDSPHVQTLEEMAVQGRLKY